MHPDLPLMARGIAGERPRRPTVALYQDRMSGLMNP